MLALSAWDPLAVLLLPVVLNRSAAWPLALFSLPVVFEPSAKAPLAVLWPPVVLDPSAKAPKAVLSPSPVHGATTLSRQVPSALVPPAVLRRPSLTVGFN